MMVTTPVAMEDTKEVKQADDVAAPKKRVRQRKPKEPKEPKPEKEEKPEKEKKEPTPKKER